MIKKRLVSVLLMTVLIAGIMFSVNPGVNFVQAAGAYLVNDDFNSIATESAPSGWITDTSGGTVSVKEVPFAGDKSVKVYKSSTANTSSATKTFANSSGKVVVEAKIKPTDTAGYKNAPYIQDSNGNSIVSVAFDNGSIKSYVGSTLTTIKSFNAGEWYIIKVQIDTATNTYDLYVDGIRMLHDVQVRTPSSTVGKVNFAISSGNAGSMYFDNVKVYTLAAFIGGPVAPIFDVNNYGATGNGTTYDTVAIQSAINACTSGGTVYLHNGTFLTGMIKLKSNMTLYIDSTATILSSQRDSDFPSQNPPTDNYQLVNCRKALIYAEGATNLTIDGGGNIDGNTFTSKWLSGGYTESLRPITIWTVLCDNVKIQNLHVKFSAMWTIVCMEDTDLTVSNITEKCNTTSNKDGLDIVDCKNVVVKDCTINSGDDSICLKSGTRSGMDNVLVKNCYITTSGCAQGLKFGTASYGSLTNVTFQDCYIKNVDKAAIALESIDGSDIYNINYNRIEFQDAGSAIFILLGDRGNFPVGDVHKIGSIDTVHFTDIIGKDMKYSWGSAISGTIIDGTTYKLKNLYFTNVNITFKGGLTSIPQDPPEYVGQYPDPNLWGNLPAYAYFIRHASGVTFTNCTTNNTSWDARSATVKRDVQ